MRKVLFLLGTIFVITAFLLILFYHSENKFYDYNKIIIKDISKVQVVDGDTLKVFLNNKKIYIRIKDIDTPEYKKKQKKFVIDYYHVKNISCLDKYGILAKDYVENLIKNSNNITIIIYGKDKYNRFLADVLINGSVNLAELLLKNGYSFLYTKDLIHKEYINYLKIAKNNKLGLWSCIY